MRVRFAPAPTGYLHVGGARTALYNWLFARHHSGVFILRIEDTDRERSTDESVEGIQDVLRWLELDWDEGPAVGGPYGPYRQTERLDLYRQITEELATRESAYPCYCTPRELEERRKQALARGEPPGYDGRCRNLSEEDRRVFETEGRPKAWRFATPGRDVTVQDLVHGEATFPASDLRDFVILRSDGTPTYLLAAAIDDWKMEVSHVLRGEDLHSSTPRQLLIMEALGVERVPRYAHLPLLLGSDRAPLSKRHGSVSVEWFREQGFLPEALVNYLALLGWSYDDHTELFTRGQLIEYFDLSRVARNPAVFDPEKLEWMNGHYIREAPDEVLAQRIQEVLERAGIGSDLETVRRAVPPVKERMKTLAEAVGLLRFLFEEVQPDEKARALIEKAGPKHFRLAADRLSGQDEWTAERIHEALDALSEELGLSRTKAWQPIRAAVTGSTVSPPLPESMALLGQERTLARLEAAAAT
ncbi:MAG: glutamate--tRNA ligase [Actinomycetota bacterium]